MCAIKSTYVHLLHLILHTHYHFLMTSGTLFTHEHVEVVATGITCGQWCHILSKGIFGSSFIGLYPTWNIFLHKRFPTIDLNTISVFLVKLPINKFTYKGTRGCMHQYWSQNTGHKLQPVFLRPVKIFKNQHVLISQFLKIWIVVGQSPTYIMHINKVGCKFRLTTICCHHMIGGLLKSADHHVRACFQMKQSFSLLMQLVSLKGKWDAF